MIYLVDVEDAKTDEEHTACMEALLSASLNVTTIYGQPLGRTEEGTILLNWPVGRFDPKHLCKMARKMINGCQKASS
jgi:hypothetical protein